MNSDQCISAYVDNIRDYIEKTIPGAAPDDKYIQHYSTTQSFHNPERNLKFPSYVPLSGPTNIRSNRSTTIRSRLNVSDRNLLCMSVRGSEVVVGGADHGLRVLKSTGGFLKSTRKLYSKKFGHTEWVTTVIHMGDGQIVSGGMDSRICVWRGVQCQDLIGHVGSISKLQPMSDSYLISSSYDRSLKIWDLNKPSSPLASLHGHKGAILDFELSEDNIAVSGGRDGRLISWDLSRTVPLTSFVAHTGHVTQLRGTSNAKIFVTGGYDGSIRCWDLRTSRKIHEEGISRECVVTGIEMNPTRTRAVAVAADDTVVVFDTVRMTRLCAWRETDTNHIYSAYFGADNTILLGTGNGDLMSRRDSGELTSRVKVDDNAVRCVQIDHEGYIVAATDDGNVITL